ncbi:MYXO-CTERM sorting domain-containing protein [Paraliomyxa miuraensis]|uniref:MYXO-CTERM sorting domain-containing protein n=1 Tax=Paraliomyxa miuraensis TaxID=376150 RepID=UPI002253FE06|nr:MYXO-CTERM sorting domain-containing protein [Paraliomyxa miuraensis]MCX4243377.1 MYXO-CTERM sorting domain-containing protein [Paraliomyxa miuraensis]
MPLRTPNPRWPFPALVLVGALAWPGAARADFEITYVFVDEDGNALVNDKLNGTEMNNYVNRATCQCGERLGARVFLNQTVGTPYPGSTQVRTYVGFNCNSGQEGVGIDRPCVLLHDGQANDYDDGGRVITFEQMWLSSRSETTNTPPDDATPILPCGSSQVGNAGIWVCVESNDEPGCQSEEFVVQADTSTNGGGTTTPTDPTMGGESTGNNVRFDYVPPQDEFSGFTASPGDTRIVISWDKDEVADTVGFRVLCADIDGNPPFTKISGVPTGQSRTNGKLYYEAESLCPDEVVYGGETDTTGSGTFGDTGDVGTSTGDGLTTTGDGLTTTGDGLTTTSGSASTTSGGMGTTGGDPLDSPLSSLDWRYVCSEHISGTGTTAEISGLENGQTYEFLVVAYDAAGNPKVVSEVLTATPIETRDFWEQCEQQGDLCGDGGFCSCRTDGGSPLAAWLGTGLLLLGVAARRRRCG